MYNSETCIILERRKTDLIAAVAEMTRDMAQEGDKLCDGFRKSEGFNGGSRARKRK
jgi:hypothetical protein